MKLDTVNAEIKKIKNRREELFELKEPIDKELSSTYDRLEKLKNQRDKLLLKENKTDWEWLLSSNDDDSTAKYDARQEELTKIGLRASGGYFHETEQAMIEIVLTKNDEKSYNKTLKGLKVILHLIKPIAGNKIIGIFEHTLSEGGIYNLTIGKNIKLEKITFGRTRTEKEFETLEDAIKYIQENHWYE